VLSAGFVPSLPVEPVEPEEPVESVEPLVSAEPLESVEPAEPESLDVPEPSVDWLSPVAGVVVESCGAVLPPVGCSCCVAGSGVPPVVDEHATRLPESISVARLTKTHFLFTV